MFIGLAIGLHPDYMRHDRDDYLMINYTNIMDPKLVEISPYKDFPTNGIKFDFSSAVSVIHPQ
ncbi:hypothetical protein SK128_000004, partial [Halocaridina rubra]